MQYRFATESRNYSCLSPGHALRTWRRAPAFPVRLAQEIFLQCREYLAGEGRTGPYSVYDPCCGTAYLLTVLGAVFNKHVDQLIGSDISVEALEFADKNLGLLTVGGLAARVDELRGDHAQYGRASAPVALESCRSLQGMLTREIPVRTFLADALGDDLVLELTGHSVDMVLTDIPHGSGSDWRRGSSSGDLPAGPADQLLEGLVRALRPSRPIIAIASQKGIPISAAGAVRLRRFTVGKRQVMFFRAVL